MFPIRDHNPSQQTPYVTYALIALNILVFLSYLPAFGDDVRLASIFEDWAMTPAEVSSGDQTYTLLTSMFMHGGIMHIAGNMLFLWIFGDNLEEELGHVGFTLFYLICGVGAALAQMAFDPGSTIPMVGASGAIAGVMGGYLLLFPKARVDVIFILVIFFKIFPIPAWVMLGLWFALQLFAGYTANPDLGGVAYWAHAGGFVIGFLYILPIWLSRGGTQYWEQTHGHPPHPEAEYVLQRSSVPRVRRK